MEIRYGYRVHREFEYVDQTGAKQVNKAYPTRCRERARIDLSTNAWRRFREVYADQPISLAFDLQNCCAGVWISVLERVAYGVLKAPSEMPKVIFVIGHWRSGTLTTVTSPNRCLKNGIHYIQYTDEVI